MLMCKKKKKKKKVDILSKIRCVITRDICHSDENK